MLCYFTPYQLIKVDVEEVMYIVKELWHGRSARDQSIKDVGRGMWRSVNELMLVRWECNLLVDFQNSLLWSLCPLSLSLNAAFLYC